MQDTLGISLPRIDAPAKVTGEARFPGDLTMPGMLHMKVLFARRPHARIRRIDTGRAQAYPGVIAVFTAKDVPFNGFGLIMPDMPVLCGDVVRFVGDKVALVVAESEKAAAAALSLIEVDYEDLPVVADPRQAMQPDAPLVHEEKGSNILVKYRIRKGDVAQGFAQADVIVKGEYRTPFQEHAYLQPEAGLAYVDDDGRIVVHTAGQWAHEDRKQIAQALQLPADRIQVVYAYAGGAFGGREDMSVQIILALAAWRLDQRGLRRPVKIVWSREESIIGHHKRHAMHIHAKWGATRAGKVVAAEVEVIGDAGAYASTSTKVLGNTTLFCTGPYEIPNVKVDTYAVYTNNIPTGAMRGFGSPQGHFAAELQMNKLAEALKMDPVELRLKNIFRDGSILSTGTPLPQGVSAAKVLEECARATGWRQVQGRWTKPRGYKRGYRGIQGARGKFAPRNSQFAIRNSQLATGIGIACGFKNVGFSFGFPEKCTTTIELRGRGDIEQVVVKIAASEVGQGAHTVIAQMAAEATGVSLDKVRLLTEHTDLPEAGTVSASRMTFMAGNAIRGAAEIALQKWRAEERPAIATFTYRPPPTSPYDPETGQAAPNFAYGYVTQVAEVEVDTETGQVRLVRVVSANDVGQAINPALVEGQIEGAVVQAQGYAILENFVIKDGHVLTPYLSNYLIPTVLDVPVQVESHILQHADPRGPWGARGVGEMPYVPLAAAVVSAVHDATGVWFDEIPLVPWRVVEGLKGKGGKEGDTRRYKGISHKLSPALLG